ncbi:MAG: EAL domain-containing protein [bacterium]|nr:EAL domain-containing protein [bacterium]
MKNKPRKILLLSNNSKTIQYWVEEFKAFQVEILTCEDIQAAKAILSQFSICVLVTDLIFSTKMGLESYQLIRYAATNFPEIIIAAFTENLSHEIDELTRKSGAHFVVEKNKPIQENLLLNLEKIGLLQKCRNKSTNKTLFAHLMPLEYFLGNTKTIKAELQPIVSIQKEACFTLGMESLARIINNANSWSPELLFAYASNKELLFEMDLACIKSALIESEPIKNQGKLFLNVRPLSLVNPDFLPDFISMCEHYGFLTNNIVLELTEQQSIINRKQFFATVSQLREHKIQIALDDFGVGFANLNWIEDLKPEYIKISGLFCQDLESDKIKQAIIQSISQLAIRLKIETILEHVETADQFEIAKKLGVDNAQGFYFCAPKSCNQLQQYEWLTKHPLNTDYCIK